MYRTALGFLCVLGTISSYQGENISSNLVPKCKLNDGGFLQCWKGAIENLKPYLIKGIPELKIPPLEPLQVPTFTVNRNVSNVAVYRAVLKHFSYAGAKNFEILDFKVDPKALTLQLKVRVPLLNYTVTGSANGTVLGISLEAEGKAYGKFTNVVIDMLLTGTKYNKDGNSYVKWKTTNDGVKYDKFQIAFKDNSENVRYKLITDGISENIVLFESHVTPVVKYSMEYFIINAINNAHAKYPFNVLYPTT